MRRHDSDAHDPPTGRSRPLRLTLALAGAAAFAAVTVGLPARRDGGPSPARPKPTVVLVHGAFADASGWNDVTERLQKRGYTVLAAANPLRGLASDAEYVKSILSTIEGPIVLVGHSYGGAVITNAATGNPNVEALVYVAAYALDAGERLIDANALGGGHTDLADHLVIRPYPGAPEGDADGYIDPAFFHELFADDLPDEANRRDGGVTAARCPVGAVHARPATRVEDHPELVPRRVPGPHDPAGGRAGHGRTRRTRRRRDRQLARRDDEPPR